MITLKEFMKLYEPEFANDKVDVKLCTVVRVGNLTQSVDLGTFNVVEGKIRDIDMEKMVVEKFTIPVHTKSSGSLVCMEITVSNNGMVNTRKRI